MRIRWIDLGAFVAGLVIGMAAPDGQAQEVPTRSPPAAAAEDLDLPPLPIPPEPPGAAEEAENPAPGAAPADNPAPGAAPADNPAPAAAPVGSAAVPSGINLGLPVGLRPGGGGAPTIAQEEAEAPPFEGPGWLDRALGLGESPIHIHGWIQNTFTGNTNGTPADGQNFGLYPNHLANQWMGNQYYVVFERTMERGEELDWGFRIDNLFGNDWQVTKAYGFFDHAFTPLSFAGFDLPQAYGEVHLPVLTRGGFDAKFGRWYSIGGYESVMATRRPLLSWPYIATYFPFTLSGLMTTFHASDRLNIFNGTVPGVDRWFNAHFKWTYIGGVGWTSEDGKSTATFVVTTGPNQLPYFLKGNTTFATIVPTNITPPPFMAGLPNPGYAHNNRTYTQNVVTHQWTDKLTQAVEFSAAFEQNTPNAGPHGTSRDTRWFGGVNWFLYQLTPKLTGVWRTEVFHDGSPFLTGVSDTYYDFTLGALYKPHDWLWIRPEVRYDWAQFHEPFNDGTRSSRFTIGIGVIVLF